MVATPYNRSLCALTLPFSGGGTYVPLNTVTLSAYPLVVLEQQSGNMELI